MFSDTIDFSRIEEDGYPLIRYHGMICGNRTAALVAANGTIDWACLPRFDSDPVFASLLDSRRGGHFSIRPADTSDLKVYQNYKEMTNILLEFNVNPNICLWGLHISVNLGKIDSRIFGCGDKVGKS